MFHLGKHVSQPKVERGVMISWSTMQHVLLMSLVDWCPDKCYDILHQYTCTGLQVWILENLILKLEILEDYSSYICVANQGCFRNNANSIWFHKKDLLRLFRKYYRFVPIIVEKILQLIYKRILDPIWRVQAHTARVYL